MDFLGVYWLLILLFFIIFFAKGWHKLSSTSLYSQKIFWAAIGVPLSAFFFFGYFAWAGHTPELSAEGFNRFVSISTLPLGLLSLSIPLVAIMTSVHRSIQTETQISAANVQIELAKKKNSLDEFFLREKNFVDKCTFIEKQVGDFKLMLKDGVGDFTLSIAAPHKLFKTIYQTSPKNGIITYELTGFISGEIFNRIHTIDENIELHFECLKGSKKDDVDGELSRIFVILRAVCQTFDLLSVAVCPTPYFWVRGESTRFQLCISSEAEFKYWLRKYIVLIDALVNAVGCDKRYSLFNTRKYVFNGSNFFLSFKKGEIVHDYIGVDWNETVNPF